MMPQEHRVWGNLVCPQRSRCSPWKQNLCVFGRKKKKLEHPTTPRTQVSLYAVGPSAFFFDEKRLSPATKPSTPPASPNQQQINHNQQRSTLTNNNNNMTHTHMRRSCCRVCLLRAAEPPRVPGAPGSTSREWLPRSATRRSRPRRRASRRRT